MFSNRYVTLGQTSDQEKVQKEKNKLKLFEMKVKIFRVWEKGRFAPKTQLKNLITIFWASDFSVSDSGKRVRVLVFVLNRS